MSKSSNFFGQPIYGQLIKSLDREKNLSCEVLVDCMHQNPKGLMEYREQMVVHKS